MLLLKNSCFLLTLQRYDDFCNHTRNMMYFPQKSALLLIYIKLLCANTIDLCAKTGLFYTCLQCATIFHDFRSLI